MSLKLSFEVRMNFPYVLTIEATQVGLYNPPPYDRQWVSPLFIPYLSINAEICRNRTKLVKMQCGVI